MQLIDGVKISRQILEELKQEISSKKLDLKLAIVLASKDEASKVYTSLKAKRAEEIGVKTETYSLEINEDLKNNLIDKIKELNANTSVNGILLQLPLDESIREFTDEIIDTIESSKDVDGLTSMNQNKLEKGEKTFIPATVAAVIECIKYTCPKDLVENDNEDSYLGTFLKDKRIVILNDSKLIGKPLFSLLKQYNVSAEVLNKYSEDIDAKTREADILITATGQTQILDASKVKDSCTIIDITSVKKNDTILGDVTRSAELDEKIAWLTPVPGGVGPITIACLLKNLVKGIT